MAKQRSGYIADHLNKLSEQLLDMRPAVDAYITPDRSPVTAIADTPAPNLFRPLIIITNMERAMPPLGLLFFVPPRPVMIVGRSWQRPW
jgi:hypothetical protein